MHPFLQRQLIHYIVFIVKKVSVHNSIHFDYNNNCIQMFRLHTGIHVDVHINIFIIDGKRCETEGTVSFE